MPLTLIVVLEPTIPSFLERVATAFDAGFKPRFVRVVLRETVGVTFFGYTMYAAGAPASLVTLKMAEPPFANGTGD
jgi:hypothetical protein